VAVAPSTRIASFGSCTPGSCTLMRLAACRVTIGSLMPSSSTRRRSVVMFCSMATSCRRLISACVMRISTYVPSAPSPEVICRLPSGAFSASIAACRSEALRSTTRTAPLPEVTAP
jgi:hypothetical protein